MNNNNNDVLVQSSIRCYEASNILFTTENQFTVHWNFDFIKCSSMSWHWDALVNALFIIWSSSIPYHKYTMLQWTAVIVILIIESMIELPEYVHW